MDTPERMIDEWIAQAKAGQLGWSELAEKLLVHEHSEGIHQPDADRLRRCGFGEVIYGSGKKSEWIRDIARKLLDGGQAEVLATRVEPEKARVLQADFSFTRYDDSGRTLRLSNREIATVGDSPPALPLERAKVSIVTAGSTDLPVASEALETLRWMGVDAGLISDVGVAGPYRLLAHLESLRECHCLIVVAGMEGALVSVVGGLVQCPVIAVPTSVGYGANFEGITTLLSMMSSCAAGVSVVNIDAGFKAAYVAGLFAAQVARSSVETQS